ncbi:trichohyalin-like [Sebastes umbrosus]|uniref:trichohyalin-like n=1 Tax=Sebastes umbrosus TaxID=72105 RepID=UPI0018A0EA59|nr:trichohyalin-like [Sebastes umbrosus]XP_037639361.1 trichohyalin-like [Sebastes umbrosus]XP_037639362.1 trichohyalin-like [Sebastes umbrosus]XP_037639363.1 trichohyalin-like [Sebastes umbrosus]XP_037639364.1 trichohyalin-like [Sebastes umbrosus]XP_037639365.1 trichohyalin-like [Sebastes umbrosus]
MFRLTPASRPEDKLLKARQGQKMQWVNETEQQPRGRVQNSSRVVLTPHLEERPKLPQLEVEGKLLQRTAKQAERFTEHKTRQQIVFENMAALQKKQATARTLREKQSFAQYEANRAAELARQKQEQEANSAALRHTHFDFLQMQIQEKRQQEMAKRQSDLDASRARDQDSKLFHHEEKLKFMKAREKKIDIQNFNMAMAAEKRETLQEQNAAMVNAKADRFTERQTNQKIAFGNMAALQKEQATARTLREKQSLAQWEAKKVAVLEKQKQEQVANNAAMRRTQLAGIQMQMQEKRQQEMAKRQSNLDASRARDQDNKLFHHEEKFKFMKAREKKIDIQNFNMAMAAEKRETLQKQNAAMANAKADRFTERQTNQKIAFDNMAALETEQATARTLREKQSLAQWEANRVAELEKQKQEQVANNAAMRRTQLAGIQMQMQEKRQKEEAERQSDLGSSWAMDKGYKLLQHEEQLDAMNARDNRIAACNFNISVAAETRFRMQEQNAANSSLFLKPTAEAKRFRKLQTCQQIVDNLTALQKEQTNLGLNSVSHKPLSLRKELTYNLSIEGSDYVSAGIGEPKYRLPLHPKPFRLR